MTAPAVGKYSGSETLGGRIVLYYLIHEQGVIGVRELSPDGVCEDGLHPGHEDLESLDHGDHLDEGKLLLAGVVVAGGPLILLRICRTLLRYID